MKKIVMKIILLGIALVMIFSLSACGGGKSITFNIAESGISAEGAETFPIITKLIKSVSELEQLCNESGLTADGQKYNAAFFSDKALIVYSFINGSISIDIRIDRVKVQDETAVVHIIRLVPKNGILFDMEKNEFFIIEVSQVDVMGINNIQISQKDKNK